jgi:hypothetical protein
MSQNLGESQHSKHLSEQPVNRVLEFGMNQNNDTRSQNEGNDFGDFEDQPMVPAQEPVSYDDMPIPTLQNQPIQNNYDEKPIGGAKAYMDDEPIKANMSNFEELLEKELQNQPDVALDEPVERKPKQKQFLKRKKPVIGPPKKESGPKYKYYAENFNDDPFAEIDSSLKPHDKKSKQNPFGNVANRKATIDAGDTAKKEKTQARKNFLVRGGGVGGGIGSKDPKTEKKDETKANKQDEPKTKKPQRTKSSARGQPKKPTRGQRKMFESDSDNENCDDSQNSEEKEPYDEPVIKQKKQEFNFGHVEQDYEVAKPPVHFEPDVNEDSLDIEHTEIPEELLEQLPEKARDAIESKLKELDFGIAKWGKLFESNSTMRKDLRTQSDKLRIDTDEFEQHSQQEIFELKEYEEAELRKLRKERKDFEKYNKDKKNGENQNKGKQEIDELRAKIDDITEEVRNKDKKSNSASEQLKAELDFLNQDNKAIQSEIRQVEKERINMMNHRRSKPTVVKDERATREIKARVVAHHDEYENESHNVNEDTPEYDDDQSQENEVQSEHESDSEEEYVMVFPDKYHNKNSPLVSETVNNNGKTQRIFENGKKELIFNNGVRKELLPDGYSIVYFNNRDVKQTYPDGKGVYFFAEANTTQTTYTNGMKVFRFGNGQVEKHYPDDTKEICFTDGTVKCIFADGEEESVFPDGTIQRIDKNGNKTIETRDGRVQTFKA